MITRTEKGRMIFPYISAEAFVSDTDKAAMQNLQKIPMLPRLCLTNPTQGH
jgi:hypothetical protein